MKSEIFNKGCLKFIEHSITLIHSGTTWAHIFIFRKYKKRAKWSTAETTDIIYNVSVLILTRHQNI
jgi:hypothetical protein